ncbi:unnamed protein product [Litomosoides sigmodontis]|uniref:Neurotransmitter-gated ion-channel ligand-binding domain-containing protein n=1 Tax=Litomosoides sigmodontis TaxID=42156 RepID=A0A3P6SJE6_LITSI|nr:unnamed protein product [Litomosoides sigmodontis]
MLPLLLLLLNSCPSNNLSFVISRNANQVELSELLEGYDYEYADNRSMQVTISFAVRHVVLHSDTLSLWCEIFQKWQDSRLKYAGIKSITIPKNTKIWRPDTNFYESVTASGAESLRLYADGAICLKQQAILTFPCTSNFVLQQSDLSVLNCSLTIGSFDNSGAESVVYRVGDVMLPKNLRDPIVAINYAITAFQEVALNGESMLQTVVQFLVESNQTIHCFNKADIYQNI